MRARLADHHRLLLVLYLEHVDLLDEQIAQLSAEIAARVRPSETALLRLESIPGVGRRTAEILAAEMGLDMARFPSAGHLASWARACTRAPASACPASDGKAIRRSDEH